MSGTEETLELLLLSTVPMSRFTYLSDAAAQMNIRNLALFTDVELSGQTPLQWGDRRRRAGPLGGAVLCLDMERGSRVLP